MVRLALVDGRGSGSRALPDINLGRSTMLSTAAFYVDVASLIAQAVTTRCNLPDQDGVVRNRYVDIGGPSQGSGKSLHGLELGRKQAFDFLPGVLRNTGFQEYQAPTTNIDASAS